MKIEKFEIEKDSKLQVQTPFIRIGMGDGCGLGNCRCSEGYWISLSNGVVGLRAEFEDYKEFDRFLHETREIIL